MRAMVKGAERLELREIDEPRPSSDELLVRIEAVSLNRGEIRTVAHAREGTVPGWDVAGTVVRGAADGKGPAEGTRVAAILRSGGWAEMAAVPHWGTAAIPDGVSPADASTLPIAALTAFRALALANPLIGSRVLVTGASGGVGRFAVQLARLGGASVTAVVSDARAEAVKALGAHETVATIDETGDQRFDLILESIGGRSLASAIDRVAPEGIVVTIGNSSEEETTFNARALYGKSGARVHGLLIFDEVSSGRIGPRELRHLMELVRDGLLETSIGLRAPWTEIEDVLHALRERRVEGKAVIAIDGA